MEDKYEQSRAPEIKNMPANMGKHFYSPLGIGYFVSAMLATIYLRYKGKVSPTQPVAK
jgi:hypothetical protein